MKFLFAILFILAGFFSASAQSETPGCFKAYDAQGQEITTLCADQEVSFQDCGNKVPDENEYYVFDYKNGSAIPTPASPEKKHTYHAPGKYRVLQIANYGGATLTDTVSQVYEVKEVIPPDFTTTACASRNINVSITDQRYDRYILNFGDGQQQPAIPGGQYSHTYATEGTYTLTLTGSFTGAPCQGTATQEITVQGKIPAPKLAKLEVQQQAVSGQLQLTLQNLQPGRSYLIEQQKNTSIGFRVIATISKVVQATFVHQLTGINTTESALYRIRPIDDCGTVLNEFSNVIGNVVLSATPAEKEIALNWNSLPGASEGYALYRNGSLLKTIDKATTSYSDTDVSCGQNYTYQLIALYPDDVQSASVTQQAEISSTATPPKGHLVSTFDLNNQLQLTLDVPQGQQAQQVTFERSIAGANYEALASSPQNTYTDAAIDINKAPCYRAGYTDACGNSSAPSNITCPILLQAASAADGSTNLNWTKYEGFTDGVEQYTVELLSPDKQLIASYPASGNAYTDRILGAESLLLYRIKASAKNDTAITYSNIRTLEQPLQLYIPSAFTPNNDGLNDVFEVKGRFFENFRMRIYNSMGNVVYESSDATAGWDGTYKGTQAPAGAYAYDISITTAAGSPKQRTGTVTLLR
ncbi:gliding motility-associated C-terminal domain-containing protein [Pontibacter sp. 172403-2]|uniref:T9SS type B sorting domain-containing protein n=1 Tax=Pontibacter rufus TaxID=2791028 RepID=UPI0018AF84D3|nr:gliding motility-associated C-terminal domain-containing protein [Pontibacter sp. 172403-2]MBF9254977.1 gliding motility-associated C-terminal domain-containing protein [Pontibacter sp. 172403-2]